MDAALKAILDQWERKDMESGDFEWKSRSRRFHQRLFGLTPSDIADEDANPSLTPPEKRPKLDDTADSSVLGASSSMPMLPGSSHHDEDIPLKARIIQLCRSGALQAGDLEKIFETPEPTKLLVSLAKKANGADLCVLGPALMEAHLSDEHLSLICSSLIGPVLAGESLIIRDIAQSVISLSIARPEIIPWEICSPLLRKTPVAHPELILNLLDETQVGEKMASKCLEDFLDSRKGGLEESDLSVFEGLLGNKDIIVLSEERLLLTCSQVLVASSPGFAKNSKFGKIILNVCKKLPVKINPNVLHSLASALQNHQSFVRSAALKELNSRQDLSDS